MSDKTIILKEHEFINDKKMKIKGEVLEKGEFKTYLEKYMPDSENKPINDLQMILFIGDKEPILMSMKDMSITKKE